MAVALIGPYLCHLCYALSPPLALTSVKLNGPQAVPSFWFPPYLDFVPLSWSLSLHPGPLTCFLVVPLNLPLWLRLRTVYTEHHLPQSISFLQLAWKAERGGNRAKWG